MASRFIPPLTVTVDAEDLMVDDLCFRHAAAILGERRAAGRLKGYVEATLATNVGLARAGVVLPLGTVVELPQHTVSDDVTGVRLWDL